MNGADWWRDTHEDLAAKIEQGDPLTLRDRKRAAAAVRASAAHPPGPPVKAGRPSKLNHGDAVTLFKALREDSQWTVEDALAYVAEAHGVSENAVRDAVYKKGVSGNSP